MRIKKNPVQRVLGGKVISGVFAKNIEVFRIRENLCLSGFVRLLKNALFNKEQDNLRDCVVGKVNAVFWMSIIGLVSI